MQPPALLSEYVQEVGRAGRDGKGAIALTLVSEPTGWLDSQDRHHRQFLHHQQRNAWHQAQQLLPQLPPTGDIRTVSRQFKQAPVALSLLHQANQLTWLDPFHYKIQPRPQLNPPRPDPAVKTMQRFLYHRGCRWQFILTAFGFESPGQGLGQPGCGQCDRCLAR